MKQKRNKMWKRMFSMLLVMAMLITAIPVTAFAEPEARAIRVWFEYDDGNTQELDENGEFHLTTEDKGTFRADGYSSSRVGWMIFKRINQYTKEVWADYNSGVFQPHNESIVLPSWLEDFDTEQKLVEFKVNVEKAASIVEVKAFSGDREISMDAPCQMNGSEAQTLTLKVRKDNSEEFEPLALSNFDIEKVSGEGMILPADGTFRVDGQEAVFKATLKSDPSIFVEFKAVSSGVALQAISVSVPQVWYIDSWNGLADYYVGIQKGDNPDNNYKINYTPSNASDKEVVWEPLTEDIATHMEAFDNGIVPKKAGIAKFKVSSKSNPEISTEVSVEFRYKYPLTAANVEKEEYTVEEGNKLEFNIKATPEHATEQRFHWSYSKEGIVEVKDSVSQDALNVNTPKTTQHVINALKTGKVTVTGMPFDETGSCKPVSFDVVVTKDGEVPQGDALVMAKEDIAHGVQYLQGKSLEKYEDEWNIFSILRSGATIEQSKLDKYYESVVKQLKKSGKTMRVTDLARVALALEAMGKNPTDVDGFNVLEAIYNHKDMMTDSSNCPIFGLLALDGRNYEIPKDAKWSRKDLIDQILKFQKASGGFGLSLDNDTDVNENRDRWMAVPAVKAVYDEAVKAMEAVITPKTEIDAITEKLDKAMKDHELTENDQEVANTVIEKINGIGKVTLESKKAIEEARAAYDKLSKNQKKLVSNLETLTKAEAELKELEEEAAQAEADKKAAEAVVEKINGIGKVTLESKKTIEEARAAYEKLSEAQKKLVSNLETLTKAEAELKKLEEQQGQQGQQGQEKPETSSVTLVNKKYGVSLQGEGLTEDMELQVEALNKDSKDVERMRKEITSKKSIFRLFNIKLMKDGKEIQLPQKAILSIPVGEKYNGKELVVLACSDKDIKQLKGKVTNGSVSVEVTELMSFGVVVDTAASGNEVNGGSGAGTTNSNGGGNSSGGKGVKTGDETQVGMLILLLTLSGAAVVMTAGKKRREQK